MRRRKRVDSVDDEKGRLRPREDDSRLQPKECSYDPETRYCVKSEYSYDRIWNSYEFGNKRAGKYITKRE